MSVGDKLKGLRLKFRRTLKEQSKMLGVSLNSVYRWEHDLAAPRKSAMKKIASLYQVPLEWLFQEGGDDIYLKHEGDIMMNTEENIEQQLLWFFRKLAGHKKYKVLGYVERIYIESIDKELEGSIDTTTPDEF